MQRPSIAHRLIWITCATIGRAINVTVYGGSWHDKLCARAYREGWPRFVPVVDTISKRIWWRDTKHCRRCHMTQERARRSLRHQ